MSYLPRHPIVIEPCAVVGRINAEIDTKDNTKESAEDNTKENINGFSIKVTGCGAHWPIG
jgi:hypothetical protein